MNQLFLDTLRSAREQGLLAEVVYYALRAIRKNPNLSEAEAMQEGLDKWNLPF